VMVMRATTASTRRSSSSRIRRRRCKPISRSAARSRAPMRTS
jgi:hypothetical protein